MKANTTAASIIPGQIVMTLDELETVELTPYSPASIANDALTFREYAPDLDDQQVLGYILSLTATRERDAIVKRLLDYFGSLKSVLEARPEQLRCIKGIGEKTANLIASYVPTMKAWQRRANDTSRLISNRRELETYCKSLIAGSRTEQFWVICVNSNCRLLGKRKISEGSLSECNVYPRLVMETALNYNAHSIFLTHNHPGGTNSPSAEDIASTLQIQRLMTGVGILVLDHIIVAGDNTYSMAQHGDIEFGKRR